MKVFPYQTVPAEKVTGDDAAKTSVRWLIHKDIGARNFVMRIFEIQPEGHTPLHKHAWEHEVFALEGEGEVFDGENSISFQAGYAVFVPPNEMHQFRNRGKKLLRIICLVPYTKENMG